jgi:peroxiredoxin
LDRPAPGFQLPDLNGVLVSLEHFRGRTVILNFWSAECPWEERVDQELVPLLEAWSPDVVLLPIASNANENPGFLAGIARARGLERVLLDEQQAVANLYGALTTPHFFVLDRFGTLRYQGAFDDVTFRQRVPHVRYLQLAIDALLTGRQPDPAQTMPYGCALVRYSP